MVAHTHLPIIVACRGCRITPRRGNSEVFPPLQNRAGMIFAWALQHRVTPQYLLAKWAIDTSGNGADGVYTGDINRDGLVDVVSGWEQSGDLRLYLNPARRPCVGPRPGHIVDISDGIAIVGIEDAAFADLDLDGFYDAVISSRRAIPGPWLALARRRSSRNPATGAV